MKGIKQASELDKDFVVYTAQSKSEGEAFAPGDCAVHHR